MITPDYKKEPWKHPACWKAHVVHMTREYLCDVATNVAKCECGWAACATLARYKALDKAVNDHWQSVIAEAEAESVPA
jgi:hypothetical protein